MHDQVTVFNRANPVTLDRLQGHDVIISFLPGEAFLNVLDLLLATKIPVVTGSTGFTWPENFNQYLVERKLTWIRSHNFSLGMNVIESMIKQMQSLIKLFPEAQFKIAETHHVQKVDAPSGTAVSWKDWLGLNVAITSHRVGDTIGDHELTFESAEEKITLTHQAKDRSMFAYGALWTAKFIYNKNIHDYGLIPFNTLVQTYLTQKEI